MPDASVFVHPAALCESAQVGPRTRIWAFAHVLAHAVVGADCNICDGVYVEGGVVIGDRVTVKNATLLWDGVTIEDDVFLGPAAVFTNDLNPRADYKKQASELVRTRVCKGATVGANATVVCGTTIGPRAFIAAGAIVVDDVPAHALMVGNPARVVGWMCACGRRLAADLRCECGRAYVEGDAGLAPDGDSTR